MALLQLTVVPLGVGVGVGEYVAKFKSDLRKRKLFLSYRIWEQLLRGK